MHHSKRFSCENDGSWGGDKKQAWVSLLDCASVNQPQAVKYDAEVRARKLHLGWRRIQTQFSAVVGLLKAEPENITPRLGNYGLQQGGRGEVAATKRPIKTVRGRASSYIYSRCYPKEWRRAKKAATTGKAAILPVLTLRTM